jgi:hypothetical protein
VFSNRFLQLLAPSGEFYYKYDIFKIKCGPLLESMVLKRFSPCDGKSTVSGVSGEPYTLNSPLTYQNKCIGYRHFLRISTTLTTPISLKLV